MSDLTYFEYIKFKKNEFLPYIEIRDFQHFNLFVLKCLF